MSEPVTRTFDGRPFYLVQRLQESPVKQFKEAFPDAKVTSNPFGYGRLGDYELDYMGSAEFEWGTIPKANNRLGEAGDGLVIMKFEYKDFVFDFLYIEKEGDPTDAWVKWVEETKCDGKEPAYELHKRLTDPEGYAKDLERGWSRSTVVWWSLLDNIMWSFVDDDKTSHLQKMLTSMATEPVEFLR